MRALLRRGRAGRAICCAPATSRSTCRSAPGARGGRDLELTPREAELLELLLRNARGVVTREQALEQVWGGEGGATPNAVDRYVAYLRRKLGEPPLIRTVRGVGLRARAMRTREPASARRDRGRARRSRSRPSLLGVAVIALLRARARHSSLDAALRRRAADVAQLNASAPALLTAPGALEGGSAAGALLVQVVDRRGRIVARSASLGGRVLATRRADRAT